jgi:hypothetical protein
MIKLDNMRMIGCAMLLLAGTSLVAAGIVLTFRQNAYYLEAFAAREQAITDALNVPVSSVGGTDTHPPNVPSQDPRGALSKGSVRLEGVEAGTITAVLGIVSLALGAWLGTPRSQGGGNGLKHNAPPGNAGRTHG